MTTCFVSTVGPRQIVNNLYTKARVAVYRWHVCRSPEGSAGVATFPYARSYTPRTYRIATAYRWNEPGTGTMMCMVRSGRAGVCVHISSACGPWNSESGIESLRSRPRRINWKNCNKTVGACRVARTGLNVSLHFLATAGSSG